MSIRSHLRPGPMRGGAGLVLALAAVVYAFAASAAPVLHMAEDAEELREMAAVQASGEMGDGPLPLPAPGPLEDLDCLFCQVLSFAAHPSLADAPALAGTPYSFQVASPDQVVSSSLDEPANARGPPRL